MTNFIRCGIIGWCFEILWTSLNSFKRKERKLIGQTSLLMFPIYGIAAIIKPIYSRIEKYNVCIRGSLYTVAFFTVEYITGFLLKKYNCCPWDYSNNKYNLKGLIRLDFAPLWFTCGLIYEKILTN